EALDGICPQHSQDEEFPRKSRNGKKQRKRKRSPRRGSRDDSRREFLLGMAGDNVWLEKPLYDRAERRFQEKQLLDSGRFQEKLDSQRGEEAGTKESVAGFPGFRGGIAEARGCSHGLLAACHHVFQGVWINKADFDRAEENFMEKSRFSLPLPPRAGNSGLGTPDEGYGTALPTPAVPDGIPSNIPNRIPNNIPNSVPNGIPSDIPDGIPGDIPGDVPDGIPGLPELPVNGKPQFSSWEFLASEVWLEKPLYDRAERKFFQRGFPGNPRDPAPACQDWNQEIPGKSQNVGKGARREDPTPGIPEENSSCFFLHRDSESVWLQKLTYDEAESRFFAFRVGKTPGIPECPGGNSSQGAAPDFPTPGTKKMALDCFLHDKVWLEKHKYDDAERRFFEQHNGPLGGSSRLQERGASSILQDIARARHNIQKSLEGSSSSSSSGATGDQNELLARISHLEVENQTLHSMVSDLQRAVSRLECRLNSLEKSSHQPGPVPPTQKVEPFSLPSRKVELPARDPSAPSAPSAPKGAEEDPEDDDIDLFGSEEDEELSPLTTPHFCRFSPQNSPFLVFPVPQWDDETDMAELEARVRSVQMEGLLWGASKLVPVGFGIRKLQIQCVVEDDKVGTDLLEEEITKFEDHVQSVDIAAFNKI
ncbi:EF1D factor, partial [Serilophus lunatus]|nr:EF1D factor [Serilophus lunatus]